MEDIIRRHCVWLYVKVNQHLCIIYSPSSRLLSSPIYSTTRTYCIQSPFSSPLLASPQPYSVLLYYPDSNISSPPSQLRLRLKLPYSVQRSFTPTVHYQLTSAQLLHPTASYPALSPSHVPSPAFPYCPVLPSLSLATLHHYYYYTTLH